MVLDHEKGLAELKKRLSSYALNEFNVLQARLLEIIHRERLYGGSSAEKWAVIDQLNRLSLQYLPVSFNDLCMLDDEVLTVDVRAATTSMASEPHFADLEVRIFPCEDAGYPVELTLDGQQSFPRGYLPADIAGWRASGDAVADGVALFSVLFSPPLDTAWAKIAGQAPQRRIRLWIDTQSPALHALPWELLHVDHVWVSAHSETPFSRYLPGETGWQTAAKTETLRVLAVISNPRDLERFNLVALDEEKERDILTRAVSEHTGIILDFLKPPVTMAHLADKLRHSHYHVLHYVGHGEFSQRSRQSVLYMEDGAGNVKVVTEHTLCTFLRHQYAQPYLVFLAACQSATHATTEALLGLGPALVRAGVPAVLAMRDQVQIQVAQEFSRVFYEQVAAHHIVDLAANEARSALLVGGHTTLATPVLFMRLKTGKLWED